MLSAVSATALLTLRARADEHRRKDRFFADPLSVDWLARIVWPDTLDRVYGAWLQAKTAVRVAEIDRLLDQRLAITPDATVVELGCGLSSRRARIASTSASRWIDLDLPEIIALREALAVERDRTIACSVLDRRWFEAIRANDAESIIFVAEGLFYYLRKDEVRRLFADLAVRFSGATMIFDIIGDLDFRRSRAITMRIGAPIAWSVSRFEETFAELGLDVIPGLEPDAVVRGSIDRYAERFGPFVRAVLETARRFEPLSRRRSGIMVGRLSPKRQS